MYLQKDEEWRHSIWCGICGKDLSFENGKKRNKKVTCLPFSFKKNKQKHAHPFRISMLSHIYRHLCGIIIKKTCFLFLSSTLNIHSTTLSSRCETKYKIYVFLYDLTGFLSTLSCQSSTLLLTLVTWDRLISVIRPLKPRPPSKAR